VPLSAAVTPALEVAVNYPRFRFTGGVRGGRGSVGDVKNMLLDTSKLKSRGWKPRHNSEESVALAITQILSKQR
jgi:UDP-glucose 4-epimerase